MEKAKTVDFLDQNLIRGLHNVIESSDIFKYEEPLKHKYNFLCVLKDRMFSAVEYVNKHASAPKTEEEFINFLVYSAIIRDGIIKMYENIYQKKPPFTEEKKYFKNVKKYIEPYFTEETQPTDDMFFEYLRSMAFAHPFDTSARSRPFMQAGEHQLCPWVIVDKGFLTIETKNAVGIRIYSNMFEDEMLDIIFSFDDLKAYVKSRFENIKTVTAWAKQELTEHRENWQQVKINRKQDPIAVLSDIKSTLSERFQDGYSINKIKSYLECPLTVEQNAENVLKFRNAIISMIPKLCDCVDALDLEGMEQAIYSVLMRPKKMHSQAHYQLEKIFCYLDKRSSVIDPYSNEAWGLKQAKLFSQEFAKKWVVIDTQNMTYDEIKLLVHTACYLEAKEQAKFDK